MKEERPWGWYEVIDQGDRYKVKNIEVKSGSPFSSIIPLSTYLYGYFSCKTSIVFHNICLYYTPLLCLSQANSYLYVGISPSSSSSSSSSGVNTNSSSPVLTPSISGCGAGGL